MPMLQGMDDRTILGPPGGFQDWMLWLACPPGYKRDRVVEVWREQWGNETSYWRLGDIPVEVNVANLWWRPG